MRRKTDLKNTFSPLFPSSPSLFSILYLLSCITAETQGVGGYHQLTAWFIFASPSSSGKLSCGKNPVWSLSHRRQFSMNFSSRSFSHRLLFSMYCSRLSPSQKVAVLPGNLLLHGLFSPRIPRSWLETALAWISHGVTASFWASTLSGAGLLQRL